MFWIHHGENRHGRQQCHISHVNITEAPSAEVSGEKYDHGVIRRRRIGGQLQGDRGLLSRRPP